MTSPLPAVPCARRFSRGALAAFAVAWAVPGRAAPCRVEVEGAAVPREWQWATASLVAEGLTEEECASIEIDISDHGARLTFTTADGRHAERDLAGPDELRSTVEALRVKGPPPAFVPRAGPVEGADTTGGNRQEPAPPEVQAKRLRGPSRARLSQGPSSNAGRRASVILALQVGARGSDMLQSPVLSGSLSWLSRNWELGVIASSDVQYVDNRAPPLDTGASALVLGVSGGRREPLGSFALLCGGRLSVAALFVAPVGPARTPIDDRSFEPRIGAYLGLAVPRSTLFRLRVDLGGDLVFANSPPGADGATPAWALTGLIGVEVGGS